MLPELNSLSILLLSLSIPPCNDFLLGLLFTVSCKQNPNRTFVLSNVVNDWLLLDFVTTGELLKGSLIAGRRLVPVLMTVVNRSFKRLPLGLNYLAATQRATRECGSLFRKSANIELFGSCTGTGVGDRGGGLIFYAAKNLFRSVEFLFENVVPIKSFQLVLKLVWFIILPLKELRSVEGLGDQNPIALRDGLFNLSLSLVLSLSFFFDSAAFRFENSS